MYFFPYKILGVFQMCLVQKGSKAKSIKLSMKVGCGGLSTTDKKQEQEKSEKNLAKTWHFREVFLYSTLHHFVCRNLNCSLRKFLIPLNLLLCIYLLYHRFHSLKKVHAEYSKLWAVTVLYSTMLENNNKKIAENQILHGHHRTLIVDSTGVCSISDNGHK